MRRSLATRIAKHLAHAGHNAMPEPILKHVSGMKDAPSVPVLEASQLPESLFTGEYVARSQPCVIRGAVRHWPAMEKWRDKDYLKQSCGHHNVFLYPHENFMGLERMEAGKRSIRFAEAVEELHSENTKVATLQFPEQLSELLPDIIGFSFLTKAKPPILYQPAVRYFIYRNAGTTWHYHPVDETLMCQVVGSKKIGLLAANTRFQKALHSIFFQEDYYDEPSAFAWLDQADLRWFSAHLEEGDALYIPPLWWHGVIPASPFFGMTAAVAFRSPLHVIADTIRKMDCGDIDMVGFTSLPEINRLMGAAREAGLALDVRRSAPLSISIRPDVGTHAKPDIPVVPP